MVLKEMESIFSYEFRRTMQNKMANLIARELQFSGLLNIIYLSMGRKEKGTNFEDDSEDLMKVQSFC